MLTISFCEKSKRTVESIPEYHLVINGMPIWNSWAAAAVHGGKVSAGIDGEGALTVLSDYSFSDFEPMFDLFFLCLPQPVYELISSVVVIFRDHDSPMLEFGFSFDPEHWAKPWSISQFAEALQYIIREHYIPGLTCYQKGKIVSENLGLKCEVSSSSARIEEEIKRWSEVILSVCMETEGIIANRMRKDALVTFFAFPKEIRSACQQYLVYFIQFLEDFGIKAKSEIQEQARGVLFTVIPESGAEALQRVHDALDAYLHFPSIPEFTVEVNRCKDIAVQQLAANVLHLKSQLALAHATLQLKDATIESLHLSLQHRQLLSEPISSKAAPCTDTESGSEPLIGDLVSVTKYKGKGFELNLPLILRNLKRVFDPDKQDNT